MMHENAMMTSKKMSMENLEDEATYGDGIFTMRHMKKIFNGEKIVCM